MGISRVSSPAAVGLGVPKEENMVSTTTRRQRERERHHREILAAAMSCFLRKGFDRTTMAEVAAEAGFAVGTLYKFFVDKQALYKAIILETATDFHTRLTAALKPPGSEIERIERFVDARMELLVKHRRIGPLFFAGTAGAILSPTVVLEKEIQVMYEETLGTLSSIFRSGIRKKVFVPADPRMLFILLEGLANAFIPPLVANPEAFTAEEMATAVKAVFFRGVCL
jgi:TetR/AcrR family transcriptional regulator